MQHELFPNHPLDLMFVALKTGGHLESVLQFLVEWTTQGSQTHVGFLAAPLHSIISCRHMSGTLVIF
jgi:hypothetical protein